MNLAERFNRWFERSRPTYGILTTWILLSFAVALALLPPVFHEGPRAETMATMFGWLPEAVVRSPWTTHVCRVVLVASALLWFAGRLLPWSCWLTALSFTMVWALRMENVANGAHIFHATTWLLWIHAAWMQFVHREWQAARQAGRLRETCLYPRWVFLLSVFALGVFHTWAGLTKIAESGLDWGNGLSLQLWVYLWGWSHSPFGYFVLAHRTFAAILQTGAMVIESLSFLTWFGKWPRLILGVGILGFYTGVLGTFVDYGFHFNWILVAWLLLPVEAWFRRRESVSREVAGDPGAVQVEAALATGS
ncbi:MAG: hypothetical protein KDA83_08540 [Planctomycetales bacterium]|nr:hypothetical protein [Planctomycetales bacterium]